MTDLASSRIVLAFGWRELLVSNATAYVRATLDRLLPSLLMPDPEVFDLVNEARLDAQAHMDFSTWRPDGADQYAQDLLRGFFDEQQFLQRQVREFAFAALFHLLERTVQKILRDADRMHGGAVLKGEKEPLDFNAMLRVIARGGYDIGGQPFTRDLHQLNLIANAVKHGHGRSLTQLASEFPDLLLRRAPGEDLTPEHLFLTAELLSELSASVAAFWEAFPAQQFAAESNQLAPTPQGES
jgi:hypothetical protein